MIKLKEFLKRSESIVALWKKVRWILKKSKKLYKKITKKIKAGWKKAPRKAIKLLRKLPKRIRKVFKKLKLQKIIKKVLKVTIKRIKRSKKVLRKAIKELRKLPKRSKKILKKAIKMLRKSPKRIRKVFKKIWKFIYKKTLLLLGYCIIIPISFLVPKNDSVVLTSRFGDFEGNLKYLFIYLNSLNEQSVKFVFLTEKKHVYTKLREKGFEVWFYPSISTFFKMFRTRLLIVDGNEWTKNLKYFFLFSAKKVQVWHGTGLKTIGLLKPSINKLSKFRKILKKEYTFYHLLALTSEFQVKVRGKAFRYGTLLINGLPRNDMFFTKITSDDGLGCNYELIDRLIEYKQKGLSVVAYTPTWRKHSENFDHLDLSSLNSFAQKNNIMLVIKLHSKHNCDLDRFNFSNIIEYDRYADVYPLLSLTDLLITDYSSIYLDFLLLDRPITFFPYDSEKYIGGERDLLLDYNKTTPGPKCYNQEELQEEIYVQVVERVDKYKSLRNEMRNKFFKYHDGHSSERLWSTIKSNFFAHYDKSKPSYNSKPSEIRSFEEEKKSRDQAIAIMDKQLK
ncbi:CDP-glycerol glycerophosphotransferase family protein [Dethiobacter alkaliphilus]|uniref:CDP-glycerol glycerophosphotransferase family protein n=1 Tax=Dethiobacter alkaliphilus TaxID=427926 RepID=UPI0022264226|nr:CDP-glycerol glycerophosphotransferase family protein [Dethiobacter alkaliphilus]MCW3488832.1 CDP-glycerol glycerophosphotransferase family protein [Dethiobacter alkaliphilus]